MAEEQIDDGAGEIEPAGWRARWRLGSGALPAPERAELIDELERGREEPVDWVTFAVSRPGETEPSLLARLPFQGRGEPSALFAPEAGAVFLGCGDRAACYLSRKGVWSRAWVRDVSFGLFWGWSRHSEVVLLEAELDLVAFSPDGRELWTTGVEPPWDITVDGEDVRLNVCGTTFAFPLQSGPTEPTRPRVEPDPPTRSERPGFLRRLRRLLR